MKLAVCVIIDREVDALLLVEQNLGRGYWFPFDEIKSGETRALAAKRIASKVSSSSKSRSLMPRESLNLFLRYARTTSNFSMSSKFVVVIYCHAYRAFNPTIYL